MLAPEKLPRSLGGPLPKEAGRSMAPESPVETLRRLLSSVGYVASRAVEVVGVSQPLASHGDHFVPDPTPSTPEEEPSGNFDEPWPSDSDVKWLEH